MMSRRGLLQLVHFSLAWCLALQPCFAFADSGYDLYQVGVGETLSSILYDKLHLSPVYGRRGYIRQVILRNSGKIYQNGDLILPGDYIWIPKTNIAVRPAPSRVLASDGTLPVALAPIAIEAVAIAPVAIEPVAIAPVAIAPVAIAPRVSSPVVSPVAAAPEKTVDKSNEFMPFSRVRVSGGASFLALAGTQNSNQSNGRLLTGLSPSLELGWEQVWDPSFTSKIYLGAQSFQFEGDVNGAAISGANVFNSAFGVGGAGQISQRLSVGADVESAQTLFYVGNTSGGVKVQQAPLLRVHPQAKLILIERRPLRLGLVGGYSYYGASSLDSYTIQSGWGYDGALEISQLFKSSSELSCRAGYQERRQNTSYLSLVEQRLFSACTFSWGLL